MGGVNKLVGLGMVSAQAEAVKKRTILFPAHTGHVGDTAGFTNAHSTGEARCPASQTAAVWVIPLTGLRRGDRITSFTIVAQVESGGNTVTIDAALSSLTNAASDPTSAVLESMSQVSVTADTAVSVATSVDPVATVDVADDVFYRIVVTVTTGASTDVRLLGARLGIEEA